MDSNVIRGFFAYPSVPAIAETVRKGVFKINQLGFVNIKPWESMAIGGKFIVHEICDEIEKSEIFCADLTTLNSNVMFELGFAIARNKRIWLVVDSSVTETKVNFNKLKILTTVGYSDYRNSDDIRTDFLRDRPWEDLGRTIFSEGIRPILPSVIHDSLLYLKSRHVTEASTLISKEMARASTTMDIPLIIDDPRETTVQLLSWYGEQTYSAICVICHLIHPSREGAELHNTKYSFVAGLAHGFGKPVLMLAQGDFQAPMDYRDLFKQYQTASEAERHLHTWLVPLMEAAKQATKSQQLYIASLKNAEQLSQLKIGEPIAENEADRLVHDYFVETTAYLEALEGRQAIFVGRKGAGKSANFLKLAAALENDRRNIVCVIKPLAYEMSGIVELLGKYSSVSAKTYAIESLWKFLLYSEIAKTAETQILSRPSGEIQEHEKDLIALLDQDPELFRADFAVRLERCVASLTQKTQHDTSLEAQQKAVSEILHADVLRKLRTVIAKSLASKNRIALLVDNLDKAWDKQSDVDSLTEFILGLLGATTRVSADFRNVGLEKITLRTSLAVFLRADIFQRVVAKAREPDKIVYSKLNWADKEMLIRVVDERFSAATSLSPSEVWSRYFCPTIFEMPTKDYFLSHSLKRPRDLLFFVKAAITIAVNRRHAVVEEKDILDAEKQYSQFAVDSILVENGVSIGRLEQILYEFIGCDNVLDETEVRRILKNAGENSDNSSYLINHLCNLTFFGVEVNPGEFRFADDSNEATKNFILAQRLHERRGSDARYQINPAFWSFLEIKRPARPSDIIGE